MFVQSGGNALIRKKGIFDGKRKPLRKKRKTQHTPGFRFKRKKKSFPRAGTCSFHRTEGGDCSGKKNEKNGGFAHTRPSSRKKTLPQRRGCPGMKYLPLEKLPQDTANLEGERFPSSRGKQTFLVKKENDVSN